jgi:putative methylase
MFAIGAKRLGATSVIGVDIDEASLRSAARFAAEHNLAISFLKNDIQSVELSGDTVLMNPPFGAQKSNKHADRAFIKKALQIAPVVYSLHLSTTVSFIESMVKVLHGEIILKKRYQMPIKSTFIFHEKLVENFQVTLLKILR